MAFGRAKLPLRRGGAAAPPCLLTLAIMAGLCLLTSGPRSSAANGTRASSVPLTTQFQTTNVLFVNVQETNAAGVIVTRTRAITGENFLLGLAGFPGFPEGGGVDAGTVTAIGDTNYLQNLNGGATNATLTGNTRIGSGATSTNQTFYGVPKWGLDSIPPFDSSSALGFMEMQASGVPQLTLDLSPGTNINALEIRLGTLPDARLSGNVALKDTNNVFNGYSNTFTTPLVASNGVVYHSRAGTNLHWQTHWEVFTNAGVGTYNEPLNIAAWNIARGGGLINTNLHGVRMSIEPNYSPSGVTVVEPHPFVLRNPQHYAHPGEHRLWSGLFNPTNLNASSGWSLAPLRVWQYTNMMAGTPAGFQGNPILQVGNSTIWYFPSSMWTNGLSLSGSGNDVIFTKAGSAVANVQFSGFLNILLPGFTANASTHSFTATRANVNNTRTVFYSGNGTDPRIDMGAAFGIELQTNNQVRWSTNVDNTANPGDIALAREENTLIATNRTFGYAHFKAGNIIGTNFVGDGGGITNHGGGYVSNSIVVTGSITASGNSTNVGILRVGQAGAPGTQGRIELWSEDDTEWLPFYAEDFNIIFDSPITEVIAPSFQGNVSLGTAGYVQVDEIAAPGTPLAGKVRIYAKSDGKVYIKDDTGAETDLTATGGGSGLPGTNTVIAYSNAQRTNYISIGQGGTTNIGPAYFESFFASGAVSIAGNLTALGSSNRVNNLYSDLITAATFNPAIMNVGQMFVPFANALMSTDGNGRLHPVNVGSGISFDGTNMSATATGGFTNYAIPDANTLQHLAVNGSVVGSINHTANSYDLSAPGSGAGITLDGAGTQVIITGNLVATLGASAAGATAAFRTDSTALTTMAAVQQEARGTNTWGNDVVPFNSAPNLITNMAGNLTIAGISGFSNSRLNETHVLLNANGATRTLAIPASWYAFGGFTNGTTGAITNGTIAWLRVECIVNQYTNAFLMHGQ